MKNRIVIHEYQLQLLPLAIVTIGLLTAIPIEWRGAIGWHGRFDYRDFAENVLLYIPLGVALWQRRVASVLIYALVLSTAAETIQIWSVGRYCSPYDAIANVLGALTGARAWRHIVRDRSTRSVRLAVTGRGIAVATAATVVLVVIWSLPMRAAGITSWDLAYPLLLGNERTHDRPWQGTIAALVMLPSALSPAELRALHSSDGSSGDPVLGEAVQRQAVYMLSSPVILDGGPGIMLPRAVSHAFAEQAMRHNAFTIVVRLTTATLLQDGPARIVSFSTDPFHRNFDLGQEQEQLVFRVRTPISGPNGATPHAEITPGCR